MSYVLVFLIAIIGGVIVNLLVRHNRKAKDTARKKREKIQNRIKRYDEEK